MKDQPLSIACVFAAVLSASSAFAQTLPPVGPDRIIPPPAPPAHKAQPKPERARIPANLAAELAPVASSAGTGLSTRSAFSAGVPGAAASTSTNLSPPVTISYSGSASALLINATGAGKGAEVRINNAHNTGSALFGQTNGSGAGLTGYNDGIVGPGGKFGILNAASEQPGVWAYTGGTGSAVLGQITAASDNAPALLGQNTVSTGGIGVEGQGSAYGMLAYGGDLGIYATGDSVGVSGHSDEGFALAGASDSGTGVFASSITGLGIQTSSETGNALVAANTSSGAAIYASAAKGNAIYATASTGSTVIEADSTNAYAVLGKDLGNGYGVYGFSVAGNGVYGYGGTGYAGYFAGRVAANSYETLSDRNAKTNFKPIDGRDVLARLDELPVSTWVFKDDRKKSHMGPMAQDFHAAFHLDGADDKHINLTDIGGVSLAAIQELSRQMKQKDAQIAALEARLAALEGRQPQAAVSRTSF